MGLAALQTQERALISFDERIIKEGINWSPQVGSSPFRGAITGSATPNTLTPIVIWGITPTRFITKIKINITSDTAVQIQMQFDSTINDGHIQYWLVNLVAGVTTTLDFPYVMMRGESRISIYTYNQPATPYNITASVSAVDLTDDVNYGAAKNILVIGDSIEYNAAIGSFQSFKASDAWDWKVRNYYRDKGIDVRMAILATHGITTTGLDYQREETKFNGTKWDLIIYCAGTNDSLSGETEPNIVIRVNTCTTNYTNIVNWKKNMQPQAQMIMCGPVPIADTSREAQLVRFRTAMSGVVTSNGDSKTKYLNLGLSFTATDASQLNSDGVHPNITGNVSIYNYFKTYLDSNLPTI